MIIANTVINLCERFHCLPSQVLAEDATLLRMIRIADRDREVRGQDGE